MLRALNTFLLDRTCANDLCSLRREIFDPRWVIGDGYFDQRRLRLLLGMML